MEKLKITRAEKAAWSMNEVLVPAYMVTMVSEIDASALERLRNLAKSKGQAASYTAIILKIAALVMKQNPAANRAILGLPFLKHLYQFNNVDISIAVEKSLPFLPGLAFAPTIKNTADKSLSEISTELQMLAQCDESNHKGYATYIRILKYVPRPLGLRMINLPYLIPSLWQKYRGCAAWVNAPSKSGADLVMTTWPWPLTFSFGIVKQRPLVIDGEVKACLSIPLIMVFDRRIMGGGPAGRIFADFQGLVAKADTLFESEFK